ncbi:TVP38/TMEM64 family protein [Colwellia echini]|nr:VTT domain-containing protein [Colwellia echini]
MIMVIVICFMQWLSLSPNTTQLFTPAQITATENNSTPSAATVTEDSNSFNLQQWVINIAQQLNWQNADKSLFFNVVILFSFLSIATSIGLPRQIAAFVAGINLGVLYGVILATLATTLGCLITFSVSRYLLSDKVARKYPTKIASLSKFLGEQTFLKALVIRIFPLGSNFLTNIIAGVSKISMTAYVSGSFVGFIPQMLIFSLAGSGISLGAKNELIASAFLFIIALLLSAYMYKKHKQKNDTVKESV